MWDIFELRIYRYNMFCYTTIMQILLFIQTLVIVLYLYLSSYELVFWNLQTNSFSYTRRSNMDWRHSYILNQNSHYNSWTSFATLRHVKWNEINIPPLIVQRAFKNIQLYCFPPKLMVGNGKRWRHTSCACLKGFVSLSFVGSWLLRLDYRREVWKRRILVNTLVTERFCPRGISLSGKNKIGYFLNTLHILKPMRIVNIHYIDQTI